MRVKFTKGWKKYRPGDTADLSDGVAELLKQRGRCVEYMVPPREVTVEVTENKPPIKRGPGRPRKEYL